MLKEGCKEMKGFNTTEQNTGIIYATIAYLAWGIFPLYWKLLDDISALQILAHRIVWSFVFVLAIVFLFKKGNQLIVALKGLLTDRRTVLALIASSLLITANWFIFIWAVNSGHIIQTSLGYYINPLVSVLLGVIVLKERLLFWQVVAFVLAGIGVLVLTTQFGSFPWVSISLALSFGLYGLVKKLTKLDSLLALLLETMVITPVAFLYLSTHYINGGDAFSQASLSDQLLLMGGGVVTALPLLWFAQGAQRIPLSMMGILQYIAPTISLMIGVFLYHEEFTKVHLVTFIFIWSALVIYSASKTRVLSSIQPKLRKKKSIGA